MVDAIEMQALLQVVNAAAKFQKGYAPKIEVIGIARKEVNGAKWCCDS